MKKIAPPPEKARRRFPKYLIITLAAVLLAALAFSLVFFFLRADVMVIGGERVPYDMVANAVKTRTAGMTEEELADEGSLAQRSYRCLMQDLRAEDCRR